MIAKFTKMSFMGALFLVWFCLMPEPGLEAGAQGQPSGQDDTMLMFVGEDLETLSIASKREESAWQAPAVAQVITREELEERGIKTLSQALEMVPGFYMAKKEWGTLPYLRGIPNSVLFLYDTVPVVSDTSKSLHPMDYDLSMANVKRIEIIRGPGSVLWGPDAFAGIVNIVPMTGKDLSGVEAGLLYGTPGEEYGFFTNIGHDAGLWNTFFSVSSRSGEEDDTLCNLVRFWGNGDSSPVAPQDRYGEERPGKSRYFEASGHFSFRDWFTISARFSDYTRPYAIAGSEPDLTWRESRSAPLGFIKLEAKKGLDRFSALRFTGSYTWLKPEYEIIDYALEQKERTSYGELIYDRSFLSGQGLFTGGLSYRRKYIEDAPIWNSYLPDYLGPGNPFFLPLIREVDYDTSLWSAFGQYTHKIGNFDLWIGLRNDTHDDYKDHLSYNAGLVWSPSSMWLVKSLYGTAYRTPFAAQLLEEEEPELERIKTLSLQVAWKPSKYAEMSLCGFMSHIKNHIMEDPYAGLSLPNQQTITGVEMEARLSPMKNLDFSANLTLIDNSGADEAYYYIHHVEPGPGGTWVPVYESQRYPFDIGPESLFNLMSTWKPVERVGIFARLGYFSSRQLIYPKATEYSSCSGVWLLDISATIRDVVYPGLDLGIAVKNLFDKDYITPGTYSTIDGEPFSAEIVLRKRW